MDKENCPGRIIPVASPILNLDNLDNGIWNCGNDTNLDFKLMQELIESLGGNESIFYMEWT
jgi:hypothetical protein